MMHFIEKTKLIPPIDTIYELRDIHTAVDKMKKGDQAGKLVFSFSEKSKL